MFDSLLDAMLAPEEIPVEQILADYEQIVAALDAGSPAEQNGIEETLGRDEASTPEPVEPPLSCCAPSGWLALELDHGTADPGCLSDTELIDAVIGFERVASWASARQAMVLAEFARRRPGDHPLAARCDTPSRLSEFAPDEVGLALRLSRTTAIGRLVQAQTVTTQLPGTLAAWEAGVIDTRKASAITEASYLLPDEQCAALEARVLPRAGEQTVAQLRAALRRAVLALDPRGAHDRYQRRHRERRVEVGPDEDGMASFWALLSAPDASAAYQRLCDLARGLGADDPRGMDARRADLLVELLTGRRCGATGVCLDQNCDCSSQDLHPSPDCAGGGECPGSECPSPDCAGVDDTAVAGPTAASSGTAPATEVFEPELTDAAHLQGNERDTAGNRRPDHGHCCGVSRATPGKPLISVIVPITTLLGLDEHPAELVGHGPIPAELAREIAADGTWRRLLTDPASGTLLDYGRKTYTPPAGLADFIRARDVYCRFPICRQRAATTDLDHTIAWDNGGTTCQHNLYGCCRHDHRLKTHAPGWHVHQQPDGRITWTTPTGHTYSSHPHDYRPDPAPSRAPDPAAPDPGTTAGADPPDLDPPPF